MTTYLIADTRKGVDVAGFGVFCRMSSGLSISGACHLIVPLVFEFESCDIMSVFESFAVARPKSAMHALFECGIKILWNKGSEQFPIVLNHSPLLDRRELYLALNCEDIPALRQRRAPVEYY
jgi:hypothetical protein